jgi:hypothetical protein
LFFIVDHIFDQLFKFVHKKLLLGKVYVYLHLCKKTGYLTGKNYKKLVVLCIT